MLEDQCPCEITGLPCEFPCADCKCTIEPRSGDRVQSQAANPEERVYCNLLHPEEQSWIPDPEDIAGWELR